MVLRVSYRWYAIGTDTVHSRWSRRLYDNLHWQACERYDFYNTSLFHSQTVSRRCRAVPEFALLSGEIRKLLSCSFYEAKAKSDPVIFALPQAAMAAVAKAKRLGYVRLVLLSTLKFIYPIIESTLYEAA